MKALILFAALFATPTFATDIKFSCTDGEQSQELTLTQNHAYFSGVTFTNMMDVNTELEWRGYSFINNPWMSLLVSTPMLTAGQEGTALFTVTNLDTYEVVETYFLCSPL